MSSRLRLVFPLCLASCVLACTTAEDLVAGQAVTGQRPVQEEQAEPLYRAALAKADQEPDAVLDALEAALRAGACPTRVLSEPAFLRLHTRPRFRALIRVHARQSEIVLVTADEPGPPLSVSGTVRAADGEPLADALLFVYQTDAKGYYSPGGMDSANPRLFGYLRSAADGSYSFRTIRPERYPDEDEPVEQHIHIEVSSPAGAAQEARLGFADDPLWSKLGRSAPAWAVPVELGQDGVQRCRFDITLR
jgi:protocatechuate 3,4-dioxygenase beta subunit